MPIRTLRCLGCARQWDEILRQNEIPKCNKCGTDQVALIPTYPAAPKGDFGTTRRDSSGQACQTFDFNTPEPEQLEFDFNKKSNE